MILLNGFPPEKKIFVGSLGSAYSLKFRNLTAPFFFKKVVRLTMVRHSHLLENNIFLCFYVLFFVFNILWD